MSAIKKQDVAALLARFPDDVRILVFGGADEAGSRDLAQGAIRALADAADPMAVTDLAADGLEQDAGRLADEAAAISMFGGRRVIRVNQAGEAVGEAVALLLGAGAAGNPVVMTVGDLSKTSALRRLLEGHKAARYVHSYPMDARDAARWVVAQGRTLGLRFADGVADRLALAAGNDVGVLGQELEKFALFLAASAEHPALVEMEHVAAIGVDSAEEDMFALIAAVSAGDVQGFERQLGLLPSGNAIGVLRILARRLFQLLEARAAMDRGADAMSALKALRPPIHFREVDALVPAMRRWPRARLERALASVLAAEAAIKSPGSAGDVLGLQAVAGIAAAAAGLGAKRANA